jgi:hypothetical protein
VTGRPHGTMEKAYDGCTCAACTAALQRQAPTRARLRPVEAPPVEPGPWPIMCPDCGEPLYPHQEVETGTDVVLRDVARCSNGHRRTVTVTVRPVWPSEIAKRR